MIIETFRIIAGLILILFIPGYALSLAFYPKKTDISGSERIALSFTLSISGVMISTLFADIVLGIDTTPENIVITIIALTILSLLVWKVQLFILENNINQGFIFSNIKQFKEVVRRFLRH